MSKKELAPFGGVVVAFMFACALVGAVSFLVVAKSADKFFVGGRTLNLFVVTATLASQSLDSNAALGNIDLGYKYHCAPPPPPPPLPQRRPFRGSYA